METETENCRNVDYAVTSHEIHDATSPTFDGPKKTRRKKNSSNEFCARQDYQAVRFPSVSLHHFLITILGFSPAYIFFAVFSYFGPP